MLTESLKFNSFSGVLLNFKYKEMDTGNIVWATNRDQMFVTSGQVTCADCRVFLPSGDFPVVICCLRPRFILHGDFFASLFFRGICPDVGLSSDASPREIILARVCRRDLSIVIYVQRREDGFHIKSGLWAGGISENNCFPPDRMFVWL